jgi:hypothetical protein
MFLCKILKILAESKKIEAVEYPRFAILLISTAIPA